MPASFFIWWLALRDSKPGPRVYPLTDGLRQDHRRRPAVLDGRPVGRVHLARLVAGARGLEQLQELGVGQLAAERGERGLAAEEVLAHVARVTRRVRLQLGVRDLAKPAQQRALGVPRQHLVPRGAPQRLDHVPPGGAELRLKLLHDIEVGPHRAVEALEVAVDDEGEVVQPLPAGQREGGGRLGLVHLAVPEEGPHPGAVGVLDAPVLQVPVEPRLADRRERAEAHRDRGELPQPGESARVWVGRQPARVARRLLPEPVELRLAEPAVEERPGVDAGRRVALQVELVAGLVALLAAEEVLEAGLVEPGGGGEGGDVPTEAEPRPAGDHRGGVPPVPRRDPGLQRLVARIGGFGGGGDRVDVVRLLELGQVQTPWGVRARGVLQGAA